MAASASDVRSILSLPTPQAGPSQKRILPNAQAVSKKPEGISRELYSLIGDSAPPLTSQYAKPKLKQRPNFGGGKTRWCVAKRGEQSPNNIACVQGVEVLYQWREKRSAEALSLGKSGSGERRRCGVVFYPCIIPIY